MKILIYLFLIVTLISCTGYYRTAKIELTYFNGEKEIINVSVYDNYSKKITIYDFYLHEGCLFAKHLHITTCGVRSFKLLNSTVSK